MNLLVVRHAIAEDRDAWAETGAADEERPLTDAGRRKMKRAARGLARVAPRIDLLATSPLTRAVQTAEILAREYDALEPVVVAELIPERPLPDLLHWLQGLDDVDTVAVVGHEPHLSGIISLALTGRAGSVVELKKGAACLLEFAQRREPGAARLLWSLRPGQLRRLAR